MKTRLAVAAALLFSLFVGWLSGASHRWELDRALRASELRGDLLEAHASLLRAQVGRCNADVGEVSRRLENARDLVGRAGARLGSADPNDDVLRLQLSGFGAGIDEAQQLAAGLTRSAHGAPRRYGPASPVKISEKP
jgi:hypothetical protein